MSRRARDKNNAVVDEGKVEKKPKNLIGVDGILKLNIFFQERLPDK